MRKIRGAEGGQGSQQIGQICRIPGGIVLISRHLLSAALSSVNLSRPGLQCMCIHDVPPGPDRFNLSRSDRLTRIYLVQGKNTRNTPEAHSFEMSKEEETKETNDEDKTEGLRLRAGARGFPADRTDSLAEIWEESFAQTCRNAKGGSRKHPHNAHGGRKHLSHTFPLNFCGLLSRVPFLCDRVPA